MNVIMMIVAAIRLFFEIWKLLKEIQSYAKEVNPVGSSNTKAMFKQALDEYAKTHDKSKLIALRDKLKREAESA